LVDQINEITFYENKKKEEKKMKKKFF